LARRTGIDLEEAARREGVTVEAAQWWAPTAIGRDASGWFVTATDQMYRPMYVYSQGAIVEVDTWDSQVASDVGSYHAAIRDYLETGDDRRLTRFHGIQIGGIELETDLDVLDDIARRGGFDFESIYRMVH
jgi:hypothetical protein